MGTLFQIGSSLDGAQWRLVAGAAIGLCLFAPSSMRYVWMARSRQESRGIGQRNTLGLYVRIKACAYTLAYQLAGWGGGDSDQNDPTRQRSYRVGLWRAGIACLVLLLLGGVIVDWQGSIEGDSAPLDIVENGIWIAYVFAQLTFITLVVLVVRNVTAKSRSHKRHRDQR
jgi:hypothetical protein